MWSTASGGPFRGSAGANPIFVRHASSDVRRLIAIGLAVAVAYVVAARLGFRVALVAEQVTTVWPPTGLAGAALILWGRSLWAAILLCGVVANVDASVPLWAAAAVATGNTLEGVITAWLLLRLSGFDPALRRVRDALAFVVVGGTLATALSATVGSMTLCLAGAQPWTRLSALWQDWWLGDAVGALIVAPALLTTFRRPLARTWGVVVKAPAIVIACALMTQLLLGHLVGAGAGHHPLEYVIFPFVVGAAVRI